MSQGCNVLVNQMFGDDKGADVFREHAGKVIKSLALKAFSGLYSWRSDRHGLEFEFEDGAKIVVLDDGQSCCEHRYMTTDDTLSDYVGATLLDLEIQDGPTTTTSDGDEHEVQFLAVHTDKGIFKVATHNEHNGYYGGFDLKVLRL